MGQGDFHISSCKFDSPGRLTLNPWRAYLGPHVARCSSESSVHLFTSTLSSLTLYLHIKMDKAELRIHDRGRIEGVTITSNVLTIPEATN